MQVLKKTVMILLLTAGILNLCAEVPNRYKIDNPEGNGELFLGGVYIYASNYGDKATMDAHLRYLAQNGIKHVYLTASPTMTDPTTEELVDICAKYGIYASFQIENAYISSTNDFTGTKAQAAADFIDDYDDPVVLAYSVKEEPPSGDFIDDLLDHYSDITSYCTNYDVTNPAPMYLLHNNLSAIEDANANTTGQQPIATGADRYFVRWTFSAGGYIMTPAKTLSLNAGVASDGFPEFRAETKSDQYFTAVISCNTEQKTYTKSYLQSTYPSYYSDWLTLAEDDNQGLSEDGDNINIWSFYRPPENLTRAMMWQAVAFGSHGIMNWSCNPIPGTSSFTGLLGPEFKGSDVFDEYTATLRELQPYAWLTNRMTPSTTNGLTSNPTSLMWLGNFSLSSYSAHIAVVVNGDIGTWANDSTTSFLSRSQTYRINSDGDLIDFTANTSAKTITLTNQQSNLGSMYDLATGTLIGSTSGNIDIEPGKGKFIWIGSQSDLEEVRLACGFTGLTKLVGYMNGSSQLPQNIRSIHPVDDFSNNSSYSVKSQNFEQGRRYRLHVTASSTDGATLGAYKYGFNSSWQIVSGIAASVGIWNETLNSTPQTFTSDEFVIDDVNVATARVYCYRSNQTGTLKIHDAWLEDIEHYEHISSYYKNYYSIQLNADTDKTYRLHVIARKSASTYDDAGLGMYVYNYRPKTGGGSEVYHQASIYWNTTALNEDSQKFASSTFSAYSSEASFLTVALYNIHCNRGDGETLIIEKAWVEEVQ
jgi:hypothetical protein